jgi:peptidoglycan/LPS O-acetylase OafA/YrhL
MIKKIVSKLWNASFETPVYLNVSNIPSLDGLRAISILWVIFGHAKLSHNTIPGLFLFIDTVFGGGQLGVKFFFVISGFLITTLLIKEKIKTNTVNLKKFYIRRFLRIFPVFYIYLLVVFILNRVLHVGIDTLTFLGAALYLTNFHIFPESWAIMHSWSLAVEEQYYLLWPSIFKKNTKLAIVIAVLFIAIAPFLRVFVYYFPVYTRVLLAPFINDADSIFIGSLLAIISFKGMINWSFFSRYKIVITVIGFLLMWFISNETLHGRYGKILLPFGNTFTAITFSFIIISNIIPSKDFIFKLLNGSAFTLIGRLSYSIYVWQQLFFLAPENFPGARFSWNRFPVNLILVAIISITSYYGFEKYFLKLKSKFKA